MLKSVRHCGGDPVISRSTSTANCRERPSKNFLAQEYREGFARLGVRRPLIGKIVNTLRAKGQHVKPDPTRNLSSDLDDNHICDCAEHGDADFTVTLNQKDSPQAFAAGENNWPRRPCPVGRQEFGVGIQEACDVYACSEPAKLES